jgi:two-component system sensor histidine kinase EvgS
MNGIIGFAKILNYSGLLEEQRKKYREIIINSSEQLMRIIEDIIEISKLVASKVNVKYTSIEVDSLLNNLINSYKNKSNDKVVLSLINKLDKKENRIISDESILVKILGSLIDNALKFTKEGYVKVSCKTNKNNLEFCVKDSGIGIKPKTLKVIFDYFRQEEESLTRFFGGLGIGLSIAGGNVKLLNGEIVVDSEKGKGSTFTVIIPYKPEGNTEKIIKKDIYNENLASFKNNYNVLIAEDEPINSFFLETLLSGMKLNIDVEHAENGKQAVDICQENEEIDLVFMDLKMPIMDGVEATKQIKGFRKNLPIIAQTAYSTDENKEKAKQAGFDGFISKPIDVSDLNEIINKYIVKD